VECNAPQSVLHIKNAPQLQFLLAQFTMNDGLRKKCVDVAITTKDGEKATFGRSYQ